MRLLLILPICLALFAGGQSPMERGTQAYHSMHYQEAVENFKAAVAQNPANVEAHLALAAAYGAQWVPGSNSDVNRSNLKEAVSEYHTVLQLDPSNKIAFESLGQLAYNDALTASDKSGLDESAKWYQELLSVDPNNRAGHYFLGVIAWTKAYYPVAEARRKLGISADFSGALPNHIVRESLAGQYDSVVANGIENLREALAIKTDDEDAMTYLNLLLRVRSALDASAEHSARDLAEAERWSLLSLEVRRQKQAPQTEPAIPRPRIVAAPPPPPPNGPNSVVPEVTAKVAEANLQSKADPVYPPLALSARVQGSVAFRITIAEDGRVRQLMLLHGHPLLVQAAREAVLQYLYRPFIMDGRPVSVTTEVTVQFSLPSSG
jgi:TonB family protein